MSRHEDLAVKHLSKRLAGRRIVSVRYMTDDEMRACAWFRRSVVLVLDDGTVLFPMSDDEGNDAGVLCGLARGREFLAPRLPAAKGGAA